MNWSYDCFVRSGASTDLKSCSDKCLNYLTIVILS
uniref:Uncharacterized protein n=1 Tax=Siphoviridae sp. ctHip2 TaxID=2827830 RepID=A0A8S5RWI5_9CAUD|nr:MAG TPA: hypothetical protein [Siphoviridae sp. ctHip2]